MPASPVADLLDQLQLEPQGPTTFLARSGGPPEGDAYFRMFGGLVAAQALRAGQMTVRSGLHANSLHGYFIAEGKLDEDAADVPDPDDADTTWTERPHPDYPPAAVFEFRDIPVPPLETQGPRPSVARWWARTVEPLPDDRDLHTCVLTYLSDLHGLTAIAVPLGVPWQEQRQTASLDHSVHFHRPIRMDEWVLVEMSPVSNSGNRGLVRNTIHSHGGVLGASVSQEGLLRLNRPG